MSSLDAEAAVPAVIMAQNVLDEVHIEVDSMGWHYNTEQDVELAFDSNGDIFVPTTIVRLDVKAGNHSAMDIVLRGNRLYDLKEHTYTFTTPIKIDAIYHRAWDDLPEPAARYITVRAGRILQDRVIGSQAQNAYASRDEYTALVSLREFEGDTGDYTMLQAPDVAKTIFRGPLSGVTSR